MFSLEELHFLKIDKQTRSMQVNIFPNIHKGHDILFR